MFNFLISNTLFSVNKIIIWIFHLVHLSVCGFLHAFCVYKWNKYSCTRVCSTPLDSTLSGILTKNNNLFIRLVTKTFLLDEKLHFLQKMADDKNSIILSPWQILKMKSGQISKEDLFGQLSKLQRGKVPPERR